MSSFTQHQLNILRCANGTQQQIIYQSLARMSAVTVNVVVGQPADCSVFWLKWLRSSSCQVLFLLQLQRGSWTQ